MSGESSIFIKLRLLTWKYFRYRRFHWILTLAEIIVPILLALESMEVRKRIFENEVVHKDAFQHPELSVGKLLASVNYTSLHYSPVNIVTTKLAECVLNTISMYEIFSSIPDNKRHFRVFLSGRVDNNRGSREPMRNYSADTESGLVSTMLIHDSLIPVGVIFLRTDNVLEYKIRDKRTWYADELFVEEESEQNGPYTPGWCSIGLQN